MKHESTKEYMKHVCYIEYILTFTHVQVDLCKLEIN